MIIDDVVKKVLTKKQLDVIPIVDEFSKTHMIMWWTAVALNLWHRESIDFDVLNLLYLNFYQT